MALEPGTYISDLDIANPVSSTDDPGISAGHLRLIKKTIKASFPAVSGAVTPTHTELNFVDGVTSAIQTQLDAKLGTSLTSARIFVGNGSNVATGVAVSGDVTITNAGVTAIASGVIVNADVNASAAIDASKIGAGSVSNTEFSYLDGVSSAIQTQLDTLRVGRVLRSADTLRVADSGKTVHCADSVTVGPNSTYAIELYAKIRVVNISVASINIVAGSGVTLRLAGTATTGTRALAEWGVAELTQIATDEWIAWGTGLT